MNRHIFHRKHRLGTLDNSRGGSRRKVRGDPRCTPLPAGLRTGASMRGLPRLSGLFAQRLRGLCTSSSGINITPKCAQVRVLLILRLEGMRVSVTVAVHPLNAMHVPPTPQRITDLNSKREGAPRLLRISVEPGGCSGFQYAFSMFDKVELEAEDRCSRRCGEYDLAQLPTSLAQPPSGHLASLL